MTDESTALGDGGVEAVEVEAETSADDAGANVEAEIEEEAVIEDEAEPGDGDAEEDGGDEESEDEAEEVIEFDFGGNKLSVPKDSVPEELADQIDKFTKGTWSDYTRKSQDIAERSKSLEARESAVERMANLNDETLSTYSQGLRIREEIEQLSRQVQDDALWQSDPDTARRASDMLARKQAEFQSVINKVSEVEAEFSKAQQEETARRMDDGRAQAEKYVKGFSEKAPEVVDYVVKEFGLTKEQAETWPLNPMTAVFAYKAMMFDRMQAKAKESTKAKPAAPDKPVKSTTKGKAARANLDLVADADKISTDEWMRRRNQQLAKKQA